MMALKAAAASEPDATPNAEAEGEEEEQDVAVEDVVEKTQMANGAGHVYQRNENLTLRVGKLPKHWEKKRDPVRLLLRHPGQGGLWRGAFTRRMVGYWPHLFQEPPNPRDLVGRPTQRCCP
jgi:hypothetical protein